MFLVFLINVVSSCRPFVRDRFIYPTQGEQYSIQMDQFFENQCNQFQCVGCSEGIEVKNVIEIAHSSQLNYTFSKVIWNFTHFAGLTDQLLVIYEQDPQTFVINAVFKINLPLNFTCLNLVFTKNAYAIMIDCYSQKNSLELFQLIGEQFVIAYSAPNYQPMRSQFQFFLDKQQEYILYAEYYENYSILTLLQQIEYNNQYLNQSTYNCSDFQDFISTPNFVYLQDSNILYQISIQNMQFQCKNNQTYSFDSSIISFSVYLSLQKAAQCDQLIVLFKSLFIKFFECSESFEYYYDGYNQPSLYLSQSSFIRCTENFIFIWNSTLMAILKNDQSYQILQFLNLSDVNIIVFDDIQNRLFTFGQNIIQLIFNYLNQLLQLYIVFTPLQYNFYFGLQISVQQFSLKKY